MASHFFNFCRNSWLLIRRAKLVLKDDSVATKGDEKEENLTARCVDELNEETSSHSKEDLKAR